MSEWSFLGNAIGQAQGVLNQYHAFGLNYLNRKLENADNMKMWERMNQYNTPAAQLSRLIAAGANPTAAMSAILGGSVGQQTANSPAETGSYTPTDMSHVVSDGVALQQSMDNHELVQSQVAKNYAEVKDIDPESPYGQARLAEAWNRVYLSESEENLNYARLGLTEEQAKEARAHRRLLTQEAHKAHQEFVRLSKENKNFDEFQRLSLRKLAAETGISEAEASTIMQRIQASIDLQLAQARKANADAEVTEKTMEAIVNKATYDALKAEYEQSKASIERDVISLFSVPAFSWRESEDRSYAAWLGYAKTYAQLESYRNHRTSSTFPQSVFYPWQNKGKHF